MYRQYVNYDFQTFFQSQENLSKWQKFRKRCRTLFKDKSNEANVHHPTIKKHQKRLTSGAATGISSAVMEATGTLMASGIKMSHFIYMLSIQNDTILKNWLSISSATLDIFSLQAIGTYSKMRYFLRLWWKRL